MAIRVARLALTACAVIPAGCWSMPEPYARDPLIQNEKRQRGSFEKLEAVKPPVEPAAPPAPPGVQEWVKVEPGRQ